MPKGSKPGERRGGRQKGTPNRRTIWKDSAMEIMRHEGVNPMQILARAAAGEFMSELQLRAAMELAKYGWSQLQRVEHVGRDGGPVEVAAINLHALSVGELQELYRLRAKMEAAAVGESETASGQVVDVKAIAGGE